MTNTQARIAAAGLLVMPLVACGQWQRVGTDVTPDPNVVVPGLFDAVAPYRAMGLVAAGDPLPFVANVQFVAADTPDSAFAVFAVALSNAALSFRKSGEHFEARYRVDVAFRRDGVIVGQVGNDQLVRVATFAETQRHDDAVIFQQILRLTPGPLTAHVSVRDRRGRTASEAEATFNVPRYGTGPALSSVLQVYRSLGRDELSAPPQVVLNPRSSIPYGSDTLYLYVEAYGLEAAATAHFRAFDQADQVIWRDTLELERRGPLQAGYVAIDPGRLPVGEVRVEASVPATQVTASTRILVSFSDEWAVVNFTELLSLLRYFGQDREIRSMQEAPAEERAALWREFWERTDPNPITSEHEGLTEYFRRLSAANRLFQEPGTPGWLTDRGEVIVTLGGPDEEHDLSSGLQTRNGLRIIRWNYISERLTLDFIDESGFGRFRLTTASRAEYQRVLNRVRRSE